MTDNNKNSFYAVRADENNPNWDKLINRETKLYTRNNEMRSEFERDYTRVINGTAYRRMKHKTQVFFSPENDHICTRSEHVAHVESVSYTIAKFLGLNTELTKAIATSHDLGHSPFGHQGERILSEISERDIGKKFWHERNGLDVVDKIELLEDDKRNLQNLNLTYAVRDGIISHCGEIDENFLKPRSEYINLDDYTYPNQYAPYTWEGCVVKISDKISYLGRDIEDAITMGILDENLDELYKLLGREKNVAINNTVIINNLIYDLCHNSSIEKGLCFSNEMFNTINDIKRFNVEYIYMSEKLRPSKEYFKLIINHIYDTIKKSYKNRERMQELYPKLIRDFYNWYEAYTKNNRADVYKNTALFEDNEKDFCSAIIYYIAGMTDNYAIKIYNSII